LVLALVLPIACPGIPIPSPSSRSSRIVIIMIMIVRLLLLLIPHHDLLIDAPLRTRIIVVDELWMVRMRRW